MNKLIKTLKKSIKTERFIISTLIILSIGFPRPR